MNFANWNENVFFSNAVMGGIGRLYTLSYEDFAVLNYVPDRNVAVICFEKDSVVWNKNKEGIQTFVLTIQLWSNKLVKTFERFALVVHHVHCMLLNVSTLLRRWAVWNELMLLKVWPLSSAVVSVK